METNNLNLIEVEANVKVPMEKVWELWTSPEHIKQWNNANEDWITPKAVNDLKPGGIFNYRMEAKDGSMGFDYWGTYTSVVPNEILEVVLGDNRILKIKFESNGDETKVKEAFEAESTNPREMQQMGWQAILNNFKRYAEAQP